MALGLKWAAVKINIPRTQKIGSNEKLKKTNIISVRVLSGVFKTSGAKVLIKMNMIYSLTGQSGPKGARTENGAFISLSHLYKCEQTSLLGKKKPTVRRTFHQERARHPLTTSARISDELPSA